MDHFYFFLRVLIENMPVFSKSSVDKYAVCVLNENMVYVCFRFFMSPMEYLPVFSLICDILFIIEFLRKSCVSVILT